MLTPFDIPDIVRHIFHYLSDYDILYFMCTCQTFYQLKCHVTLNESYDDRFEAFACCFKTVALCNDPIDLNMFDHLESLHVQSDCMMHLSIIPSNVNHFELIVCKNYDLNGLTKLLRTSTLKSITVKNSARVSLIFNEIILPSNLQRLELENTIIYVLPSSLRYFKYYGRNKFMMKMNNHIEKLVHLEELHVLYSDCLNLSHLSSLKRLTIVTCDDLIQLPSSVYYFKTRFMDFNDHILDSIHLKELVVKDHVNRLPPNLCKFKTHIVNANRLSIPSTLTHLKCHTLINTHNKLHSNTLIYLGVKCSLHGDSFINLKLLPHLRILKVFDLYNVLNLRQSKIETMQVCNSWHYNISSINDYPKTLVTLHIHDCDNDYIIIPRNLQSFYIKSNSEEEI